MNYLKEPTRIGILALCFLTGCFAERTPWHEAEGFIEGAKGKIVNRFYGGGRRITVQPKSFSYNVYTGAYPIEARITWQGRSSQRHYYWSDGVLVVKERGVEVTWRAMGMSRNLQSYLSSMRLTHGEVGKTVAVFPADHPKPDPTSRLSR